MTIFRASGAGQSYSVPSWASLIEIICIGAGSGGGGGRTRAVGSAGGGGGGGAGGALTRAIFPRYTLPDVLYVQVPFGTAGSASGSSASAAGRSYVTTAPNSLGDIRSSICVSGNADATGGASGAAGGTGGNGGTGGTAATAAQCIFLHGALFTSIAGQSGVDGGDSTTGTAITALALGNPICGGGAGGAGIDAANTAFNGGDITGAGLIPTIAGGVSDTVTGGAGGSFSIPKPFLGTGGSGGGNGSGGGTPVGGKGGNGAIGCGGGGGGSGVTGGQGGRGGDGLVIIYAW